MSPAASASSATVAPPPEPGPAGHLDFVVVGHVDHGKSTLIGRLLFDTGSVPDGRAEQIAEACKAERMEFEYAFLLDALLEEQAQNVTMDSTRVPFRTARRSFTIIDAPGHKEFLKNMITGAACADAAVLLVDAQEGLREQTRRHGYLLSLLGIQQVIVAINKMDLVSYDAAVFSRLEREMTEFLVRLHLPPSRVIPVSARHGEGLIKPSPAMKWYRGPALLEVLEQCNGRIRPERSPLRINIQDIYRFDSRRIVAGFVESGAVAIGTTVEFHPGRKQTRVRSIERWPANTNDRPISAKAERVGAGRAVAVTLEEEIYVERGNVASTPDSRPEETHQFVGRIFWLDHEPLRVGDTLPLRLGTQEHDARVVAVARVLDAVTLDASQAPGNEVRRHEVAEIRIRTRRALICDPAGVVPPLGRFVLMRNGRIGGGGVIDTVIAEADGHDELPVTPAARESLLGHRGAIIWLTGFSGAGKSTLATALERRLLRAGVLPVVLDGDVLRAGLCHGLTFSESDRKENIRRTAEAALLIAESGAVVITALISPFRADRDLAAERCRARGVAFAEVYVNASLAECEKRDPKQLYRRARAGEIPAFTGISSPYEPPLAPALELHTDQETVDQSLAKLTALAIDLARPTNRDAHVGADI